MKKIFVRQQDGRYSASIDITIEEWKKCLCNEFVFNKTSRKMIMDWYEQPFHQATSKQVMEFNNISGKTPYNGIVVGLGKRIVKFLNRFEVIDSSEKGNSYWIIPFEGWWKKGNNHEFVWKIREQLIIALEDLGLVTPNDEKFPQQEEGFEIVPSMEGKKVSYYTNKYERNLRNREAAIRLHGCICSICGFDFEKTYGPLGNGFIEVHHIHPLSQNQQEKKINPQTDLICVCSNCHRMLHRRRNEFLMPEDLKKIVTTQK